MKACESYTHSDLCHRGQWCTGEQTPCSTNTLYLLLICEWWRCTTLVLLPEEQHLISQRRRRKKIHILLGVTQLSNMSGVGVKNICSALTCSVATID